MVAAAKRVLRSSALESLGLQDKRDMSMLIAQSALQVSGLLYCSPCPWACSCRQVCISHDHGLGHLQHVTSPHACWPPTMSAGPA